MGSATIIDKYKNDSLHIVDYMLGRKKKNRYLYPGRSGEVHLSTEGARGMSIKYGKTPHK